MRRREKNLESLEVPMTNDRIKRLSFNLRRFGDGVSIDDNRETF
jgi:hypothetical protein